MKPGDLVRTISDNHQYYGIVVRRKKRHNTDSVKVYFPYRFNKVFDFCVDTKDIKVIDEV